MPDRVLVTGGAAGLGRAIAQRFLAAGARVAVVDRVGDVAAVAAELGCVGVEADVAGDGIEAAIGDVVERLGGLDLLVNNAGVAIVGPLLEADEADLRRVFDVNVIGAWRCTRAAVPTLAESGGCIVNMVSAAGTAGSPMLAAYSMSKAALIRMTEALAVELRPAGVRVNAICPALTGPTRMVDALREPMAAMGVPWKRVLAKQGRMGKAGEIADLVAFLASDAAAMVNGAHYLIDGGLTAGVL
jgi:NAD(P)-dependent dehydrogenase (short-subunit alcohol dehydrogenase family)